MSAHGDRSIFPRAIRNLRAFLAQFRRTAMLAGALALVAPFAASAQSNAVRERVTDRVDHGSTSHSFGKHSPARARPVRSRRRAARFADGSHSCSS